MQDFNPKYQTFQTKYQKFVTEYQTATEYSNGKNAVEYNPNSPNKSNQPDVEYKKAETYCDWLLEYIKLLTHSIQQETATVESILELKEIIQSKMKDQKTILSQTENTLKEVHTKMCELAKEEYDIESKKLDEEEQREHKRIELEFQAKRKQKDDIYKEKTN